MLNWRGLILEFSARRIISMPIQAIHFLILFLNYCSHIITSPGVQGAVLCLIWQGGLSFHF
jgi:hypothetical protein